jgi:hypothetical protein
MKTYFRKKFLTFGEFIAAAHVAWGWTPGQWICVARCQRTLASSFEDHNILCFPSRISITARLE